MAGTLYVVATPIGNLSDITLRALEILKAADLIAAEDTRVTRNLLRHFAIQTPLTSYHQHSLSRKTEQLLEALQAGKIVAIVSDAGTPGISDPGHEIISKAIGEGVPVVSIPGPSAIITALVVSGLPTRRFAFEGFPPRRANERRNYFRELADDPRTLVFYEAPPRILRTLKDMHTVWGDRRIAVVREATKMFEEVRRGLISSVIEHFTEVEPRGEFTIVAEGNAGKVEEAESEEVESALRALLEEGISERDAVRRLTEAYPLSRNEAYRTLLRIKEEKEHED